MVADRIHARHGWAKIYATMERNTSPSSAADCAAADPGRQGPARPSRRPRAAGPGAGPQLPAAAPRSRGLPGRARPDRHAAVHADPARARRGADDDPLRPPDPGAHRRRRATCASRSPRTRRSTTSCARPPPSTASASGSRAPASSTRWCWRTTPSRAQLIIGTDSHTPNAGGLGACAVGVGGADAVEVIAGLPWEVLYPTHIAVYLTGELSGWTAPKDVILYVAGQLTVSGGTNAIVEYIGPGARTISATGKATITNMGAELGATTSMFPADERMATLPARDRPRRPRAAGRAVPAPAGARPGGRSASPSATTTGSSSSTCRALEPHVVGPHSPDRARPISELAAEVARPGNGFVDAISTALIGSCTNSSYEDMSRAADVAAQAKAHGVKAARAVAGDAGLGAGARHDRARRPDAVARGHRRHRAGECLRPVHRPVAPRRRRQPASPNTIVTSYNRNFPRRNDGQATTMNFIASPEIVTALRARGPAVVQSADRHA